MNPTPDLDRLEAYLAGQLSSEELRRLEADLKANPQLCEALIRLGRDEAVLVEWARAAQIASQVFADASNHEPMPATLPLRRSRSSHRRWVALAASLAALLLISVLVGSWIRPGGSLLGVPLGQLEDVQGDVFVVTTSGATFAAARGQDLYPGQGIRTGDSSFAVVKYGKSTRLEVGAETTISLPARGPTPGPVRLEEGVLTADVPPQEGNPMLVQTQYAEVRADGSRVSFTTAPGSTRVDSEEGAIHMTRTSDGRSIRVPSGSYAVAATERGPFASRSIPVQLTKPRDTFREGSGPVQVAMLSPDGKSLATGGADGNVRVWEVKTGLVRLSFKAGARNIRALAWSPDGATLVTAVPPVDEKDKWVRVWDAVTGHERATLKSLKGRVFAVAFSPDGTTLVTGGPGGRAGGEVKFWDTATWRERTAHSGHGRDVQAVAFTPDGALLATGSADGQITVWDVQAGQERRTIAAHTAEVRTLAFSPDGKTLVSGSRDTTVKLWNPLSGAELRTLRDHTGEVRCVAFSADGRLLATCGGDRMVKLYDADGGRERVSFRGDKKAVCWVGFSPDGRTLFTACWDRTVKLWDLDEEEPVRPGKVRT